MHSCDGCTACCKILKVKELNKTGNSWCQHCAIGEGCGIYETRPESCRVYECLWLKTQRGGKPLSLALRPDRSRVVLGTSNGDDIVLYVSVDHPDAWKRGEMGKFVDELLADSVDVMLMCGEKVQTLPRKGRASRR